MKVEIYDPSEEASLPETIMTLRLEQGTGNRVKLNAVNPKTGERLPYGTIMSFSTGAVFGADELKFRPSAGCYVGGISNKIREEGAE